MRIFKDCISWYISQSVQFIMLIITYLIINEERTEEMCTSEYILCEHVHIIWAKKSCE